MSGTKVAVVTGANKGIGFEIVRAICKKFDGDVYLTARDEGRGIAAVAALEKDGFHPKFHQLAIDDAGSIQKLKDFLSEKYGGLDVLVNNAGMAFKHSSTAPVTEQAVTTVGINFSATLNVCNVLFPLLRPHARVVNVSSSEGHLSKVVSQDLRAEFSKPNLTEDELVKLVDQYLDDVKNGVHIDKGWPRSTYQMSKVALSALSFIQQRKFDEEPEKDLVVNAVHPGYVDTDMTSHRGPLTPEQGAVAPSYCALLPANVKSPRGEYIWYDCKVTSWV